ncbi:ComEA family DNA-binding protein [Porphyromonas sp.]|uniref:ComEA family DNA-binding protein n=1 Tax=Porphyromonas sp. TaxID=1924944 RepID=UPI0026DC08A3|nr:helix-hairpin-helix domain-containing protein [Porphyromonas sp.]MDO4695725.1 helix-hairpin-helix domain-containing protein [Porphyromonas sp.]MDO4771749.1 helix-hairpin-helix domain-containing protein [Porphyromonas sp.]
MRDWFRLNRDDRKALLIIMVLYSIFLIFLWFNKSEAEPDPPTPEVIVADQINGDSIFLIESESVPPPKKRGSEPPPVRTPKYPGPPTKGGGFITKMKPGATVDLNSADTLLLQRIPGIGPSFARRIVKYRELLGGYYCVEQLQEVYGMDREKYNKISPFMQIRTGVRRMTILVDSIPRHPYLSYKHRRVLTDILVQDPPLTWEKIMASSVFSKDDSLRLSPYIDIR